MSDYLFDTPEIRSIPVVGEDKAYPVHRIFCVGQNYAAHAAEMGSTADYEAPFYFTKQPHAVIASGSTVPYPPGTENYHYEMELAFTLDKPLFRCTPEEAADAIYSYGCALDMTRRDLQAEAKAKLRPWDLAKDSENGAVFAAQTKVTDFGAVADQRISLAVNGETKQDSTLSDMIHDCVGILCHLSQFYHLGAGDVILTGTPSGIGPVVSGDKISGQIDGLTPIELTLSAPE